MVLAKCVFTQPSSAARWFMCSTKAETLPSTQAAMMLQASFALASIAQYSRSIYRICSPGWILAVLLVSSMPARQSACAVTSSSAVWPFSSASTASSTVMIFVRLAGDAFSSIFLE